MTIAKRALSYIRNMSKVKKIIVLVFLVIFIFIAYDYKYYTVDIENVDEIVKIKISEPFNGPYYVVTDKAAIDQFINDMNGKKLTNTGRSHYVGKSYHVCFYNENDEVVFEFSTLGKGNMILKWGCTYYNYDGDIDVSRTAFDKYGDNLVYQYHN